jgi:hypothetical protein
MGFRYSRKPQKWERGNHVKIGFLGDFLVLERVDHEDPYAPDKYLVKRIKTGVPYWFTPHLGITKAEESEVFAPGRLDYAPEFSI